MLVIGVLERVDTNEKFDVVNIEHSGTNEQGFTWVMYPQGEKSSGLNQKALTMSFIGYNVLILGQTLDMERQGLWKFHPHEEIKRCSR